MREHPVSSVPGRHVHGLWNMRAMFLIEARSGYSTAYISYTSKRLLLPSDRNHDYPDAVINEECDTFTR